MPVTPFAPCGKADTEHEPEIVPPLVLLCNRQMPGENTSPAFAGTATLTSDARGTTANAMVRPLLCINLFARSTEVTEILQNF
jgi:hypothetical protein